jgi:hypothetical protein
MDATATNGSGGGGGGGGAEVEQEAERGDLALAVLGRRSSAEEETGRLWWTRARGKGFRATQRAATTTISLSLWTLLLSFPGRFHSVPWIMDDRRASISAYWTKQIVRPIRNGPSIPAFRRSRNWLCLICHVILCPAAVKKKKN